MGIDGGSTSTKAVLLDKDKNILVKCYQLSKGNPIEDTQDMFANLREQIEEQGATLKILGVGTTGYAKDILQRRAQRRRGHRRNRGAHRSRRCTSIRTPTSSATWAARTSSSSFCRTGASRTSS